MNTTNISCLFTDFMKYAEKIDTEGISPTEREFDYAGLHHKTRLIFITSHNESERNYETNTFLSGLSA